MDLLINSNNAIYYNIRVSCSILKKIKMIICFLIRNKIIAKNIFYKKLIENLLDY